MTAIFLTIIAFGFVIYFYINVCVFKFIPNKRLRYASSAAYSLILLGLIGLIIYHVEFLSTPELQLTISADFPDLIRAVAELLWPLTVMAGIFWFLPQILDFLKDPRKTAPLLAAFSGRNTSQEYQAFMGSLDIEKLPQYANLPDAQKDLIELLKNQLQNFPPDEEKSRLLIYASECQLAADFERLYNLIYGSQIQALQVLSTNANADLSSFYETHKQKTEKMPDIMHASFKEWSKLLVDTSLALESKGKFSLTNRGEAFLKFLEDRDYYLLKAF